MGRPENEFYRGSLDKITEMIRRWSVDQKRMADAMSGAMPDAGGGEPEEIIEVSSLRDTNIGGLI